MTPIPQSSARNKNRLMISDSSTGREHDCTWRLSAFVYDQASCSHRKDDGLAGHIAAEAEIGIALDKTEKLGYFWITLTKAAYICAFGVLFHFCLARASAWAPAG